MKKPFSIVVIFIGMGLFCLSPRTVMAVDPAGAAGLGAAAFLRIDNSQMFEMTSIETSLSAVLAVGVRNLLDEDLKRCVEKVAAGHKSMPKSASERIVRKTPDGVSRVKCQLSAGKLKKRIGNPRKFVQETWDFSITFSITTPDGYTFRESLEDEDDSNEVTSRIGGNYIARGAGRYTIVINFEAGSRPYVIELRDARDSARVTVAARDYRFVTQLRGMGNMLSVEKGGQGQFDDLLDRLKKDGIKVNRDQSYFKLSTVGELNGSLSFDFVIRGDKISGIRVRPGSYQLCTPVCILSSEHEIQIVATKQPNAKDLREGTTNQFARHTERYEGTMELFASEKGKTFLRWKELQVLKSQSRRWREDLSIANQSVAPSLRVEMHNTGSMASEANLYPLTPSRNFVQSSVQTDQTSDLTYLGVSKRYRASESSLRKQVHDGVSIAQGTMLLDMPLYGPAPALSGVPLTRGEIQTACAAIQPAPSRITQPWCFDDDPTRYMRVTSQSVPFGIRQLWGRAILPDGTPNFLHRGYHPFGAERIALESKGVMLETADRPLEKALLVSLDAFGFPADTFTPYSPEVRQTVLAETRAVSTRPSSVTLIVGLSDEELALGGTFDRDRKSLEALLLELEAKGTNVSVHRVRSAKQFTETLGKLPEGTVLILFLHGLPGGYAIGREMEFVPSTRVGELLRQRKVGEVMGLTCHLGMHRSIAQSVFGSLSVTYSTSGTTNPIGENFGVGRLPMSSGTDSLVEKMRQRLSSCSVPR